MRRVLQSGPPHPGMLALQQMICNVHQIRLSFPHPLCSPFGVENNFAVLAMLLVLRHSKFNSTIYYVNQHNVYLPIVTYPPWGWLSQVLFLARPD